MQPEKIENNPLLKQTIEIALEAINFCTLLDDQKKFTISKQLLRSATAIGANAMEAQNAESRADFIHKLKLAAKEADETQYWLMLCELSPHYPSNKKLEQDLLQLMRLLNSIITKSRSANI